jgi:AcrR family transcriptional regulator
MRGRRHCAADVATSSETQGIDDFAIADMAVSTGVHETSLYRRWGSREDPVVAALLDDSTTTTSISTPVLPVRI